MIVSDLLETDRCHTGTENQFTAFTNQLFATGNGFTDRTVFTFTVVPGILCDISKRKQLYQKQRYTGQT